jgi:5-formyltetrahydrofolate cyclo-ligase
MVEIDIRTQKLELRAAMKKQRSAMDFTVHRTACARITDSVRILPEWLRAQRVFIYISSVNNEADTLGLIIRLFDQGKSVFVPCCADTKRLMHAVRIASLDEVRPSRYGLMEPEYNPGRTMPPRSMDLIVAPVVAFDRAGRRLGMGGGYYDAFIAEAVCPSVGLAFSFQEVDTVPAESHDHPLDIIITDTETIRIVHD